MMSGPLTKKVKLASAKDGLGGGDSSHQQEGKSFSWTENCFICEERCHMKKRSEWSMVTSATDASGRNIFSKLLEAAQENEDHKLVSRLLGLTNGDLVVVKARYHRKKNCLGHYISGRQRFLQKDTGAGGEDTSSDEIIDQLIKEFEGSIEGRKEIHKLTTLCDRFMTLATEKGVTVSRRRFKPLLKSKWTTVNIIEKIGQPDLVCSANLNPYDFISKVAKDPEIGDDQEWKFLPDDIKSEEMTLYHASCILRRRIKSSARAVDHEYFSAEEMCLESQKEFIDPLLLKFVEWLGKEDSEHSSSPNRTDRKVVSIASDIMTMVTGNFSPKHLGLGIYVHHAYGSRLMVDMLYSLGHGISYTELRRFLTSAAVHMQSTQTVTASGGIIPKELKSKDNGGKQMIGVADNWDHLERTVDGKGTTHAMTSIFLCPRNDDDLISDRIKRVPDRTFNSDLTPGMCNIIYGIHFMLHINYEL